MKLADYHNIFFIGIGGIGMSAIARFLKSEGKKITGYDKTETALTRRLEEEGIAVHYQDSVELIPDGIDLVIYTPAIPKSHQQLNHFLNEDFKVIKRAEALGWISRSSKTIAVAGTHGKTTTSSLVSAVLDSCNIPFSAFLGGISYELDSNYVNKGNEWIVVEADEYDRSFLHLHPEITVLLSMDPDHLDIYGDHDQMIEGFWLFVQQLKEGGLLIYKEGLEEHFPQDWQDQLAEKRIRPLSFGIEEGAVRACEVRVEHGRFVFDGVLDDHRIEQVHSALPGKHNIENALGAMMIGRHLGGQDEDIKNAIGGFKGIFRRFERLFQDDKIVYIDDYAHHPTELRAAIGAARELFAGENVLGIFQPHLFSRTRDFADGFAEELAKLDEVILMPIYPARELPIKGIDAQMIADKMKDHGSVMVLETEEILERIKEVKQGVILTLGAGDIDLLRAPIKELLESK